jgi:hypothetical protein
LRDHRLGVPHPLVEPGLVRQEPLVGVQRLRRLERLTRVPRRGRCEQPTPLVEVDRREAAAQLVVESWF